MTDQQRIAMATESIARLQHRPYRRTDHTENADIALKYRIEVPRLLSMIAERDAEIERMKPAYERCIDCAIVCAKDFWLKKEDELERLREAQRWIPVTEGLPDGPQDVLVWMPRVGIRAGYYNTQEQYQCWMMGLGVPIGNVTHWMPLPSAPEEGE